MRRSIIISLCFAVGAVMMMVVGLRRNQIATLKTEQTQGLARLATPAETSFPAASSHMPQNSHPPSIELLKLRAEVGRLTNRKRELADVRAESVHLQSQLATGGTNVPGAVALPAGYMRKTAAKFVGYGTPEDTLQSFFWALHNRDAVRLLETMSPEISENFQNFQDDESRTKFFDNNNLMPGFHVTERKVEDENSIILQVQIVPGQNDLLQKMMFKRIDGQWKLKRY